VRDQAKLERILLKGPLQAGYPTDLWTLRRVAEVIEQRFQVSYHLVMCGSCWWVWGGVARSQKADPHDAMSQRLSIGSGTLGRG
jgi:hypothetical protein